MKQQLYRAMIELTNKKWSSHLLKQYTCSSISKPMIRPFMKMYKISERDMEYPPGHYQTMHDFFIRTHAKNARRIDTGPENVVSPVDAVLEDMGGIANETEMVVKGKRYSVAEMLGSDEKAEKYKGGIYLVLYLSPSHYHRIHSPVDAEVIGRWILGEHSYPVNKYGMVYGKAPLSKNYRDITELAHEQGRLAVVKVGAMFVNTIERTHENPVWKQGEEVAYFNFGSTVVLLFEQGIFQPEGNKDLPREVVVGEKIGALKRK